MPPLHNKQHRQPSQDTSTSRKADISKSTSRVLGSEGLYSTKAPLATVLLIVPGLPPSLHHRTQTSRKQELRMSGNAAQDPQQGPPAMPGPPPLCGTCNRDMNRPCGFWQASDCPDCTGRMVDCADCEGQGKITDNDGDDDAGGRVVRGCVTCLLTGRMMRCRQCDGADLVRQIAGQPPSVCDECSGRLVTRCITCGATGKVCVFVRFCTGDDFAGNARRHPLIAGFPLREDWGRVEL